MYGSGAWIGTKSIQSKMLWILSAKELVLVEFFEEEGGCSKKNIVDLQRVGIARRTSVIVM